MTTQQTRPAISIVIPVFNGNDVTQQCVASIYSETDTSFEIVFVDNASTDGVETWMRDQARTHPNVKLVRNDTNRGFPAAINQGVAEASGDYVLLCNNDVVLLPGGLDRLATRLKNDPAIGVVSPITNYIGGGPQLDESARDLSLPDAATYAARVSAQPDVGVIEAPDRLAFFCVMLPRDLFTRLGGLSEDFGIGNFEDDEFCIRVKLAGYNLGVDPLTFVFHIGSTSWKSTQIHDWWMARNRRIYYSKMERCATTYPPLAATGVRAGTPSVTVIVRTVDRPESLDQALASLANQTYRDFEVLLVLAGDVTVADLTAKFQPYLALRVVASPVRLGRAAALRKGHAHAGGHWITYLDDDDIVYPNHLEVLVDALADGATEVAFTLAHKALFDVPTGKTLARRPYRAAGFEPSAVLVDDPVPLHTLMHTRESAAAAGGIDESLDLSEDWDFLIRLLADHPYTEVRRFTCDYRFRIGAADPNVVVSNGDGRVQALDLIYSRYPAPTRIVRAQRRMTKKVLSTQVKQLRTIQAKDLPDHVMQLHMICAVAGFDPSLPDRLDDAAPGEPRSLRGLDLALYKLRRVPLVLVGTAIRFPLLRGAARWLSHRSLAFQRMSQRLYGRALDDDAGYS